MERYPFYSSSGKYKLLATMWYHYKPIRWLKFTKYWQTCAKCWQTGKTTVPLIPVVRGRSVLIAGNQVAVSTKLNIPNRCALSICPAEMVHSSLKDKHKKHKNIFSALLVIVPNWKQSECPSVIEWIDILVLS